MAYTTAIKDFLQLQEGTEYSNLVLQPNSKLPTVEVAGAPLHTVTERLITPVSKPHFKPQRTLSTREDHELMHKRFGHANIESIVKGLQDQTIKGYDVSVKRGRSGKFELLNGKCDCCIYSKHHLPLFPTASTVKGSGPGYYVVCDIRGELYVLTYTDYYTRYS